MNYKKRNHLSFTDFLWIIFPSLAVICLVLFAFYRDNLFPFGKGSITWCDMSQQVLPLLCDLKDMLSGKSGIFLNLQNAGGMNMWGVIFFFVASPLNLSVLFVDKEEIVYLVNILLVVKLALSAFTANLYFRKCMKKLPVPVGCLLSVCYGLCGYGLIMFQNIIWLDLMYLFPLLAMGLHKLFEEKKISLYVISLSLIMMIHYHIGAMTVMYIILFMGIFSFIYRKEKKYTQVGAEFAAGSLLSALISAVVWLPCFMQYLSSGRDGLKSQLSSYGFFENYMTTSPQILATAFVTSIIIYGVCSGHKRSRKLNGFLCLALLMTIPMYVEPVNLYWHLGSYMCFPGRYGFITAFVLIICGGMIFCELAPEETNSQSALIKKPGDEFSSIPALILSWVTVIGISFFTVVFITRNYSSITTYTQSLWQSSKSYHLILEIFTVVSVGFFLVIFLYRKGRLKNTAFIMLSAVLVFSQCYGNLQIYVTSPYHNSKNYTNEYKTAMELKDIIKDDDFYRVKTSSDLFDVNLLGGLGYKSLGHYTSLTSKDYMYMAKLLGYSSYWMEVGCYGGTEISDALLGIKYRIENNTLDTKADYSTSAYQVYRQNYAMPLGVVTRSDLSDCESLENLTRQEIQEEIFQKLISSDGLPVTTKYDYTFTDDVKVKENKNGYDFDCTAGSGYIYYNLNVFGRQSLYFDCFDKLSTNLNEDINGSFDIYVNGSTLECDYPSKKSNGLIYLGTFENKMVSIKIKVNRNVSCKSFGVFGVNKDRLEKEVQNVKTVGLTDKKGKISGSIKGQSGEKCVIAIPYGESLKITINGEKVKAQKVFEDMVCINLREGENNIEITNVPSSFYGGLAISLVGIALCILYAKFRGKIKYSKKFCTIINYAIMGASVILFLILYIFPCVIKLAMSCGK